jgi:hypothetical protein
MSRCARWSVVSNLLHFVLQTHSLSTKTCQRQSIGSTASTLAWRLRSEKSLIPFLSPEFGILEAPGVSLKNVTFTVIRTYWGHFRKISSVVGRSSRDSSEETSCSACWSITQMFSDTRHGTVLRLLDSWKVGRRWRYFYEPWYILCMWDWIRERSRRRREIFFHLLHYTRGTCHLVRNQCLHA